METLKIKVLLSAVKNKSLSKTAEEFDYTPSALSHMADALEEELGVTILKRTPFGVELTEDGKVIYEKLQNVVDAEKELFELAGSLSQKKERELRIGAYSSIAQYVLPELLKSFKEAYPQIKVSIKVGNSLKSWLEDDIADIVFCDNMPIGKTEFIPIINDPYLAVVPATAFENKKTVSREDLYDFSYVSTSEGKLKKYFDESKFKEVVKFDSVDDTSAILMVKEGIGITVLPSLMLKKHVKGVKTVKLEPEILRTISAYYKSKNKNALVVKQFIKHIKTRSGELK